MMSNLSAQGRVTSFDALRGFTMLWLTSAAEVIRHLPDISGNKFLGVLADQFDHVSWNRIWIPRKPGCGFNPRHICHLGSASMAVYVLPV
jgi:hypothetical protein